MGPPLVSINGDDSASRTIVRILGGAGVGLCDHEHTWQAACKSARSHKVRFSGGYVHTLREILLRATAVTTLASFCLWSIDDVLFSKDNRAMSNPNRLTALDAAFLHLEDDSTAHMHVASVMVFEGDAPTPQELTDHIVARLHLVPRYRQRLAYVPFGQGRPVWTDDPHFNPRYHIRHTGLPAPGDEETLKQLAGRLFSQRLDRSKPLWEIWLVDRLAGKRFALIAKTHHALVDGISGVDITTVLFDTSPEPLSPPGPPEPWVARPLPGPAKLLGEALLERSTVPAEMGRGARALLRAPRKALTRLQEDISNIGATTLGGYKRTRAALTFQCRDWPAPALHLAEWRSSPIQGDQGCPGRHPERCRSDSREPCSGWLSALPGTRHRRSGTQGDGASVSSL